jgi:hypothetical protein
MERGDLIKIYCKHICKCHKVSPMYNCYMLINKKPIEIFVSFYLQDPFVFN